MTLAELKKIIQDKYLHRGNFTLSSGTSSTKYFDIKGMMGDYDSMGKLLNELYKKLPRYDTYKCLGGTELGGVPLVAALWMSEQMYEYSVCYIRKSQRIHGLKKMIEGQPKSPILLVDDVISSGKTIDEAIKTLYADPYGYVPCGVLCVINRSNLEEIIIQDFMETRRIPIYSLFKESDF